MRHSSIAGFGITVIALLAHTTAGWAAAETWVSGTGNDAGTCPRTAPCRTFQFAHDQTNNNGAINVLTPGNFGPVAISKPISIVAEGVEAVINAAPNGHGILVLAPSNAVVSLRGLTIDLRGASISTGIAFSTGRALHVQNTVIRRCGAGIIVNPANASEIYVADTVVSDNSSGITVETSGIASVKAMFERVRSENNQSGFFFNANALTINATIRDSVVAGNASLGIAHSATTTNMKLMVDRTAVVNNGTGIQTIGGELYLGNSTVTGNTTGLSGTAIASYVTNQINGNGTDGTPGSTIPMK